MGWFNSIISGQSRSMCPPAPRCARCARCSAPVVSFVLGLGHPAKWAASIIEVPVFAPRAFFASGVSGEPRVVSETVGVGQPARPATRGS